MTPDEYREAGDLYEQLRELPEREREAMLASACAENQELRARVARFLAADRDADDVAFLQRPAIEDAALLVAPKGLKVPSPGTVIETTVWERSSGPGAWVSCWKGKINAWDGASPSSCFP